VGRDVETRVNFELHIDVVLFIERGIRGGLSQCSQVRAGQQHTYDPSKASTYLIYFDVNNLYDWAIYQPLDVDNFDITTIAIDSQRVTFSRWI